MLGVTIQGLSPRGRGKLGQQFGQFNGLWSIPAWAGETGAVGQPAAVGRVYPRVGGGNIVNDLDGFVCNGLSPRGRGKHKRPSCINAGGRSIPAWAGETEIAGLWVWCVRVYPRVGGGNPAVLTCGSTVRGLSPRRRGKRNRA